eukprot:gene5891-3193_t
MAPGRLTYTHPNWPVVPCGSDPQPPTVRWESRAAQAASVNRLFANSQNVAEGKQGREDSGRVALRQLGKWCIAVEGQLHGPSRALLIDAGRGLAVDEIRDEDVRAAGEVSGGEVAL